MKDIPVFATENGVASLFLNEISFRKEARVLIQATCEPQLLLDECIAFCVACGAETVYAAGHELLHQYPLYTNVLKMQRSNEGLEETNACLFPVQPHTASLWRSIYNERMKNSPNASYMTFRDESELVNSSDAYFVHRDSALIGIGRVCDGAIKVVASCVKGGGRDIVLALAQIANSNVLTLEVADHNVKALNLYLDLGFVVADKLATWYRVK